VDQSGVNPRVVLLAILALSAFAFAAATLDSTTAEKGGEGLGPSSDGSGAAVQTPTETPSTRTPAEEGEQSQQQSQQQALPITPLCIKWLENPLVVGVLLLAWAGILAGVARWQNRWIAFGVFWWIFLFGQFIYGYLTSCRTPTQSSAGNVSVNFTRPNETQGGGLLGGTEAIQPSLPTFALVAALVGLIVVVGVFVLTSDHDFVDETDDIEDEEEDVDESVDVRAVGRAAGRAADRIEADGEYENEVYRAWAEMTTHLEVERPESSTPGEFAAAAVDAGMDRDDVDRLTGLFTDTRYGGAEATEQREREAVDVLRRIEATYAGEES
jgi:hypothetical protein